jgi:hypothetical protein
MKKLIKILHVDPNWKVIYILIRGGALVKTAVSMEIALKLLAKLKFDLIISEPQNIAIMGPQAIIDKDTMRRLHYINNEHREIPLKDLERKKNRFHGRLPGLPLKANKGLLMKVT